MASRSRGHLSHAQEAALPRNWPPGAKPRQGVPDHGALVGNGGPAELALERLADRLRQPGAAADIEAVGVRVPGEGLPAELIGELHVVGGLNLLEPVRAPD